MPDPIVPVAPIFMQESRLTLGTAGDFAAALSSAALTPSGGVTTWKGLKPGSSFSFATRATWTLDATYAQDWSTPESLSVYLHEHEGEQVPFTLAPLDDPEADSFTGVVFVTPGAIGGGVDSVGESTVSMGVIGKPARVPHA